MILDAMFHVENSGLKSGALHTRGWKYSVLRKIWWIIFLPVELDCPFIATPMVSPATSRRFVEASSPAHRLLKQLYEKTNVSSFAPVGQATESL